MCTDMCTLLKTCFFFLSFNVVLLTDQWLLVYSLSLTTRWIIYWVQIRKKLSYMHGRIWIKLFETSSYIIEVHPLCLMMPKIVNKKHNPHVLKTILAQYRTRRS